MTARQHDVPAVSVLPGAYSPATSRRWSLASFVRAHSGDVSAITVLILAAIIFTAFVIWPVHDFIRGDWPAQFFPVYSYLGERLRAFDIPGWNPHQFSGSPFLGDPESGWMYVPAMVIYTLLPAEVATAAYIGFHIAFAGLALYAFARILGLNVAGSLIGGLSFALAWVAPGSMHLVIFYPVSTWLLVSLAGVELGAKATSWNTRLWSWLIAAFGFSQVLAIWLGQAAYYALMVLAGWIVYRCLLLPPQPMSLQNRLKMTFITGVAVFGLAFGISAAGVLPRLDAVQRTGLAGGVYDVASAWEEAQTGYSPPELLLEVLGGYTGSLWWYIGAVVATLAVMAPIVARKWQPMIFFLALAVGSLILSLANPTPLHQLLYAILPRFHTLHEHSPERILILLSPAVSLLAAATVSYLAAWDRSKAALVAVALVPAVAAVALAASRPVDLAFLAPEVTLLIVATSGLVICFALTRNVRFHQAALIGLVILTLWDPAGRIAFRGFIDEAKLEKSLQDSLQQDADTFLYANGAAAYIADQTATDPARYAGFDPALLPEEATIETVSPTLGYRSASSLSDSGVNWLLVHNWATWFGLDDIQGYNPIQLRRYVEYIDAMNGHRQEYHERDLFGAGLSSPLLSLLNLRFVIVPADAPDRPDLQALTKSWPTVYQDEHVRILSNENAYPRGWLVHEAEQVQPGEALSLLTSAAVDPRQVALLETSPPQLAPAAAGATETVTYARSEPDRMEIDVVAGAPALLVLSEIWDAGWTATVDGVSAPVYLADHALRAVPVAAGEHTVVLAYTPPYLRLGLVLLAVTLLVFAAAISWLRYRSRSTTTKAGI